MKKNVAGQVAKAHVLNTDRTPYNGSTTVFLTIDNGAQSSVGSGTSKGNGEHTFAPSQAQTNGNSISFTFVGTSNATGYTEYATSILTGDPYARLGTPTTTTIANDIQVRPTTAMVESYNADGAAPTIEQAVQGIFQLLTEMRVTGTAIDIKKLDGITTAFSCTTNSGTVPTTITRTG